MSSLDLKNLKFDLGEGLRSEIGSCAEGLFNGSQFEPSVPVSLIPRRIRSSPHGITAAGPELLPLEVGQQYRFTFDMAACVGCHSCEVACAEQNNLPTDTAWRRVGEIEGGTHPNTSIFHLSMACNHCLEPTCLQGCPTGAYLKLDSGIVEHVADDCIGCQYCTWNCPYSVPTFQPDRKIVTKCDMCKPRLEQGFTSACVESCPTHAIGIEVVDIADWRQDHSEADGPHLPPSDITISTTRLIVPDNIPTDTHSGGDWAIKLEHPHWPLIGVTLLTQLAMGLLFARLLVPSEIESHTGVLVAFVATAAGLIASTLHLGRPIHAWKAMRRVRYSWLSREVAAFGLFFGAVSLATAAPSMATTAFAAGCGALGVFCSSMLYVVPGRPAWNTWLTVAVFSTSGVATGATFYSTIVEDPDVRLFGIVGIALSVSTLGANLYRLNQMTELEPAGTLKLTFGPLRGWLVLRVATAFGAIAFLTAGLPWPAVVLVVLAELVSRWLFFVSVVPLSMPGAFFRGRI